jgi:hypothetical protein
MEFLTQVSPREAHYGDCTGADYELFQLAKTLRIKTICHPPDTPAYRMFTVGDEIRETGPYLVRNMQIVNESDYLVACPREEQEVARSGTWMTVRYARNMGRTVVLLYPGGGIDIQRHAL